MTEVEQKQDAGVREKTVASVDKLLRSFIIDVILGALFYLKPIFSIFLAIYIFYTSLQFISSSLQSQITLAVCRMPLSSALPLCDAHIPDFTRLVDRQVETYEQIMDQTLAKEGVTSTLALDIKRAELATQDLRTLVKYSTLTTSREMVERLNEFLDRARVIGRDLQVLQARTRSSLDNLITYNLFALKTLENVRDRRASAKELSIAYEKMMMLMEGDLQRMILKAYETLGSLSDLDEKLIALHELVTQEKNLQTNEHEKLLAELWSFLGGNRVERSTFKNNLDLLARLDDQRRHAVAQVQLTLYSLQSFQTDLEELREQVLKPSLIDIPLELHIENVGKGIDRLKNSRVAIKSADEGGGQRLIEQKKNE